MDMGEARFEALKKLYVKNNPGIEKIPSTLEDLEITLTRFESILNSAQEQLTLLNLMQEEIKSLVADLKKENEL